MNVVGVRTFNRVSRAESLVHFMENVKRTNGCSIRRDVMIASVQHLMTEETARVHADGLIDKRNASF